MASYPFPVNQLLKMDRPFGSDEWTDYSGFGIGPEHVPDLIRMAQDEELAMTPGDSAEGYAPIHAWRALGQLRAPEAIEPLLDLLAEQEDDSWWDWLTEEVPIVLGMIGPAALPAAAVRLQASRSKEWPPVYFANALTEIAKQHPETRTEVIDHLSRFLEDAATNDPGANGCVISDLMDLDATEAWPVIERAFATDHVEESIAGDADEVKYELGLGPKPEGVRDWNEQEREFHEPRIWSPAGVVDRLSGGRTAKERAEDRARQRKAEKRRQKQKRKRK